LPSGLNRWLKLGAQLFLAGRKRDNVWRQLFTMCFKAKKKQRSGAQYHTNKKRSIVFFVML
jgi:hypothetical protein